MKKKETIEDAMIDFDNAIESIQEEPKNLGSIDDAEKRAQFESAIIRERGFIDFVARDEDGEYTNKLTRKQWKAFIS